ncbi:unnamed protein product [Mytilus edulis]|uniref:RNA-directed DNA polymerase n=1 Tax=Mytilus edulis TaxID=6550 RepID=A0A8S3R1D2_MYTED|nr:unnamed protein product [Mytilus edulis]
MMMKKSINLRQISWKEGMRVMKKMPIKKKTGNLKIFTASSDNAIFRREISTPINGTVMTALEELGNSSRAAGGLQTITEESGCMDQHSTERLKTRTPLEAEGQQLLHERFVSRCNEDIRARPLMNAHSHMDEKGNDRQRTRQHNGPEKDIFRRPERNIENMHYQNTRFQDFQDCSGQGDRVPNRETNRQRSPEFRTANQHRQENVYAAPRQEIDRHTQVNSSNPKLPAFNGKDDWKVWINRFEAIARRRSWTDEEKLDELLPRIQGEAGDFVFTQLPTGVLERYTELVRELSYRYRVIENAKSFIARFASRNQKPGEKAEEYAAELKRLHHKAYPNRDRQQRKEDLLERFMRGILDEEVRFFVNYVKKPDDIDEAVYLVVECLCERRSSKFKEPYERRMQKNIRRASPLYECSDSETEIEEEEEETCDTAYRLKRAQNQKQNGPNSTSTEEIDHKNKEIKNSETSNQNDNQNKEVIQQLLDRIKVLETQIQGGDSKSEPRKPIQAKPRTKQKFFKLHGATSDGQQGALFKQGQRQPVDTKQYEGNLLKKIPEYHGAYIKGKIQNKPIVYTVDTGASRTVLSTKIFNQLNTGNKFTLSKSSSLAGAGGTPIKELGKATFSLKLGALELEKELVIAEIEDECLLGMDILQNDPSGPADVILSRGIIILRGVEIPVIQVGVDRARRVISADHYEIPGYTEAVIDIYIERREEDDYNVNTEFVIEPASNFEERYSLQMAATLVDIKDMVTNQIRVMNPYPTSASINQDAILAYAERQEGETRFFAIEDFQPNMHEADNNAIRRIQFLVPKVEKDFEPTVKVINKDEEIERKIPFHLQELYKKSTKEKAFQEKIQVGEVLIKFQECFSKNDSDIGLTSLTEHTIDTGDAVPIKQHPRRVPLAYAEAEKEAIIELQKKGIIRESSSPWASPIVLVKKKNGKMRPCIDFRRVNLVTRNVSAFPLPRITDCINAVAGSTFFSSLDLTSSYYQIPVKKQDIQKTAFCTKYGHFEFLTMPMGLNGSAATFQRTMELILQGLQWTTAIIYIDDIVVFGTTLEEHLNRLTEVLKRIMDANLKLQPEKCELLQKTITFLGHQVSAEGVKPCHQNIAKILQWPTPFNIKQVKHILGMGSFYRRFVKNYADIVRPMTDLTKKGKKFVWTDQCETAFHRIKQELTGANIIGIGAVLQQVQEGRERVIAYASRSLNRAERNYCITQQELLAVRYFVDYFRQYLLGRKFKIRSDHQALIWLFRLKEPRGRIARWIEVLSSYNFSIEYRAGKKMGHADALSRCDNPHDCECPNIDTQEPLKCGPCKKCQKRAEEMILETPDTRQETPNLIVEGEISQYKDIGEKAESREVINCDGQELIAEGKHIMKNTTCGMQTRNQARKDMTDTADSKTAETNIENRSTVCNKTLAKAQQEDQYFKPIYEGLKADKRPTKEEMAHDCILSGHLGSKRTAQKLLQKYYWYNLKEEVNNYIMRCDICEANKFPQKKPKAPLGSLLTGAPLDCLATDILGPLPTTPRNNKYVLVVTDHFTKWVEIFPVPNQNAETCASVILNEVIARFGSPLSIHSDQGRNYESNIFKELCRMLEVRKTRTSSKNPKGNAVAERFNKTLVRMIKAYLRGQQENWDLNLGCLASAYRSTVHASTGMTPNLLMLGREVRIPAELAYGSTTKYIPQDITSYGEYVDYLKEHMQIAHDVARKHLGSEARRHKEIYDSKISVYKYEQGDLVWYLNENRIKGVAPKSEKTYSGPYIIKRKMSELNFVLQLARDGTEKLIHHNKLKPYKGVNSPKWLLTVKRKLKNQ